MPRLVAQEALQLRSRSQRGMVPPASGALPGLCQPPRAYLKRPAQARRLLAALARWPAGGMLAAARGARQILGSAAGPPFRVSCASPWAAGWAACLSRAEPQPQCVRAQGRRGTAWPAAADAAARADCALRSRGATAPYRGSDPGCAGRGRAAERRRAQRAASGREHGLPLSRFQQRAQVLGLAARHPLLALADRRQRPAGSAAPAEGWLRPGAR